MNEFLDIQDFCDHTIEHKQSNEIEFIWADPRDIFFITIYYQNFSSSSNLFNTDKIIENIQYWQANWPKNRPSSKNDSGSGSSGWKRQDDWYKGVWITAQIRTESFAVQDSHDKDIQCIKITFSQLSCMEIPDEDFPVAYRRTLKLKIKFNNFFNLHQITKLRIFTPSKISSSKIKIDLDTTKFSNVKGNIAYEVSVFNGRLINKDSLIEIYYSIPEIANNFDETLVTIKFKEIKLLEQMDRFTISINDLLKHGFIFSPDLGILIQPESGSLRIEDLIDNYQKNQSVSETKSVYDRIFDLPEQTFENSMNEFKGKHRLYGVIGCESVRSKCAVTETGNLSVAKEFIMRNKGADTEKVFWNKRYSRIKFNWEINEKKIPNECFNNPINRYRLDGYFPVFITQWNDVENHISIQQTTFGAPLLGYNLEKPLEPDSDLVSMMQLTVENEHNESRKCEITVTVGEIQQLSQQEEEPSLIFKKLTLQQNHNSYICIYSKEEDLPFNRSYIFSLECSNDNFKGLELTPTTGSNLKISFNLRPREKLVLNLKFPMLSLVSSIKDFDESNYISQVNSLHSLNFNRELDLLISYWKRLLEPAGIIEVPNEEISIFFKAHIIHVLITNDREIGSHRIFGRVGALGYGTYANEVCMIVQDLDRKGLFELARNILDTFIQYQGTAGLDGDYNDIEGIFFGANGYESGRGYNQNQGFVLWTIVEHVYLSGDYNWFSSIIKSVVKGCEWIINERKFHQENLENIQKEAFGDKNRKELAYKGLLPPGGVEDITDYWYWLSTNAYNAYGLLQAALLLKKTQYGNADYILREAYNYFEQVRSLYYEAMQDSPLVQLKNGTFVPHFPCHITRKGRGYGWIQETLEGAIHLIRSEIIPYWSKEAEWIIRDYEDNLYLSQEFGYPYIEDEFEKYWFNRGGFSMQPWLLCNHIIYLFRNQPKHFLRAFFNSFAVNYREDTKMFTEHPLPTMFDWFGQLYKTSDESNFINCLRAMIIQEGVSTIIDHFINQEPIQHESKFIANERYDSLILFQSIPKEWLEDGKNIKIHKISSYFGFVSLQLNSNIKNQFIEFKMTMDSKHVSKLYTHELKYIYIVIRHPDENKPIKDIVFQDFSYEDLKSKYNNFLSIEHQTIKLELNPNIRIDSSLEIKCKIIF